MDQYAVRVPGNDGEVVVWAESPTHAAEIVAEQWLSEQDLSGDVLEVFKVLRYRFDDEPTRVAFDDDGSAMVEGETEE